jgi:hypothetical protein
MEASNRLGARIVVGAVAPALVLFTLFVPFAFFLISAAWPLAGCLFWLARR